MMFFGLGDLAYLVRERKRFGEILELKYALQPLLILALDNLPLWNLRLELCYLRVGDGWLTSATRDAL
jgi:hypothetical protein